MRQRRDGFTLIELLVAMALTLFIMAILAEAFKTGLEVFRQMKAIGDLESGLRNTTTLLRADLAADHFEGKKRLSNLDFYSDRPTQGFFRIVQSAASVSEGSDAEGLKSFRSTTHALHFTVKRRGNRREDFFAAVVPAGSPLLSTKVSYFDQSLDARVQDTANAFHSQWAEIGYYLVKTGTTIEPNNPNSAIGTPLFALYRVERLLVPNTTEINPPATLAVASSAASGYDKISYRVDPGFASMLAFNSPSDVTILANRAFDPAAQRVGRERAADARAAHLDLENLTIVFDQLDPTAMVLLDIGAQESDQADHPCVVVVCLIRQELRKVAHRLLSFQGVNQHPEGSSCWERLEAIP